MDVEGKDGKLLLAMYRLEGDALTVCYKNEPGARGRPADFTPGQGVGVEVFKRKKPRLTTARGSPWPWLGQGPAPAAWPRRRGLFLDQ